MAADLSNVSTFAAELGDGLTRLGQILWTIAVAMALVGVVTVAIVQISKTMLRPYILFLLISRWLPTMNLKDIESTILQTPPLWLQKIMRQEMIRKITLDMRRQYLGDEFQGVVQASVNRLTDAKVPERIFRISTRLFRTKFLRVNPFLPRDLYMKEVQNRVQQILERPSGDIPAFFAITRGATAFDQSLVSVVDAIIRENPATLAELPASDTATEVTGDPTSSGVAASYSAVIAAAQDHVAAAAERNLDALQIAIAVWWPVSVRLLSLFVGIVLSIFGGIKLAGLPSEWWWLLGIIGAVGSYIASIIYDAFTILGRLRPR